MHPPFGVVPFSQSNILQQVEQAEAEARIQSVAGVDAAGGLSNIVTLPTRHGPAAQAGRVSTDRIEDYQAMTPPLQRPPSLLPLSASDITAEHSLELMKILFHGTVVYLHISTVRGR